MVFLLKRNFFEMNKMELKTSKLHILVCDFSACFNINFIKLANKIRSLLRMFNYSTVAIEWI
jgi:hypothetical protein